MKTRLGAILSRARRRVYWSCTRPARARRIQELSSRGVRIAELGKGRKLICDLAVRYDRTVYLRREEVAELRLISRLLRRGDVFVDCGANIGLFTVTAAARVGAGGKVLAVEPVADTFARLSENCALNQLGDRVRLFNNALAAQAGVEVALTGDVHNTMRVDTHAPAGQPLVKTVTLDEILAGSQTVTGMKIDVEGYELEVLRGGQDTIAQFSPWMLVELNGEPATRELGAWDVHTFLTERHYRAHLPHTVLARDRTSLPDSWVSPQRYVNLLYCHGPLSAR